MMSWDTAPRRRGLVLRAASWVTSCAVPPRGWGVVMRAAPRITPAGVGSSGRWELEACPPANRVRQNTHDRRTEIDAHGSGLERRGGQVVELDPLVRGCGWLDKELHGDISRLGSKSGGGAPWRADSIVPLPEEDMARVIEVHSGTMSKQPVAALAARIRRQRDANECGERGQEVDGSYVERRPASSPEPVRPASDKRDADAAVIQAPLSPSPKRNAALRPLLAAPGNLGAVVGGEDEQGVIVREGLGQVADEDVERVDRAAVDSFRTGDARSFPDGRSRRESKAAAKEPCDVARGGSDSFHVLAPRAQRRVRQRRIHRNVDAVRVVLLEASSARGDKLVDRVLILEPKSTKVVVVRPTFACSLPPDRIVEAVRLRRR
mmetsp:Transcript_17495/g.54629  ORF Transcript_17495/g.54629 Transcript_17495/m.54629 type:complete len:378 (+) Transcript_17495:1235-2368(+)